MRPGNNHVDPSVTDNRPINAVVGAASILLFPYITGAALLTNTTRTLLPWKTPPNLLWETIQIWSVGAIAVGMLFTVFSLSHAIQTGEIGYSA